jgi:hypothetical protein
VVTVPLGQTAYKRQYSGAPEVVLKNRFLEKSPSNLREHATLLARPGSDALVLLSGGPSRGKFTKLGFFGGDLFVICGPNLFRVNSTTNLATQITGTIAGAGFVYMTWEKGVGYEYLFIADGTSLQVFSEHAYGVLTVTANPAEGDIIRIGTTYYGWRADVEFNSPAGTLANPYWAKRSTLTGIQDTDKAASLENMAALLNYSGAPGLDFSSAVPGPAADVSAVSDTDRLTVQAIVNTSAGNAIATTVQTGAVESWANTTLIGGGGTVLRTIAMPNAGEVAKAVATTSSYVLVSVGNAQKFYWLNPGELVIDPLNFAAKESNPDNILDMNAVGDQVLISGTESTENWYATGNLAAPFAPVQGRVYQRGIIEGTAVTVGDSVIFVGNDGVVYSVGYSAGADAQFGVRPISDNAIAERIRTTLRREQGLQS